MLVLEEGRQRADTEITVFIDGHAEHGAAMLADPIGIVCPAAEQRHPKRRPAYNHPYPHILASRPLADPRHPPIAAAQAADNGTVSSSKRRASRWLLISATWRRVTGPKRPSTISRYFGLAK